MSKFNGNRGDYESNSLGLSDSENYTIMIL